MPVGTWTDNYKQYLEKLLDTEKTDARGKKKASKNIIKDYKGMSTDTKKDAIKALAVEVKACKDCHIKFPETKKYLANVAASKSETGIGPWSDAFPNFNAKLIKFFIIRWSI